jgi:phospholipid-binding lipoprotein MlaA
MIRHQRLSAALLFGWSLMLIAAPARAEDGWLDWFNRGMFSFNASVSAALDGVAGGMPTVPPAVTHGMRNLAVTWIGEPLNAASHAIAGRGDDATVALRRIGVNITRGWLGTVDRAAEEGLITNPIDFGLALCVRGVPPGPFIVFPLTGIRTLRDFTADWVAAHVVLYAALFGVFQMPISVQNLALVEAAEEVITLSIAGELGEMPEDAKVDDLAIAQQRYLAGRERRCAELASDR